MPAHTPIKYDAIINKKNRIPAVLTCVLSAIASIFGSDLRLVLCKWGKRLCNQSKGHARYQSTLCNRDVHWSCCPSRYLYFPVTSICNYTSVRIIILECLGYN